MTIAFSRIKHTYETREVNECFECLNHAGYIIMFADNNEIKLISYKDAENIVREMVDENA